MKYLAAYLLLVQGGNATPAVADIKTVLEAAGIEAEESRISALLESLEGKTLDEVIAAGNAKLASVPTGGAAPAAGASAGAAAEEAAALTTTCDSVCSIKLPVCY